MANKEKIIRAEIEKEQEWHNGSLDREEIEIMEERLSIEYDDNNKRR